jgi:hypothetical protein
VVKEVKQVEMVTQVGTQVVMVTKAVTQVVTKVELVTVKVVLKGEVVQEEV